MSENQSNERQDPAETKSVDTEVQTEQQDPRGAVASNLAKNPNPSLEQPAGPVELSADAPPEQQEATPEEPQQGSEGEDTHDEG